MPSKLILRLKDGATATVCVSVLIEHADPATNPVAREQDLENLLGGMLAGTLAGEPGRVLNAEFVAAFPSEGGAE